MARKIEVEITGDSRQLEKAFDRSAKAAGRFNSNLKSTASTFDPLLKKVRDMQRRADALAQRERELQAIQAQQAGSAREWATALGTLGAAAFGVSRALEGAAAAAKVFTGENSRLTKELTQTSNEFDRLIRGDIGGFIEEAAKRFTSASERAKNYAAKLDTADKIQAALALSAQKAAAGLRQEAEMIRQAAEIAQTALTNVQALDFANRQFNETIINGTKYLVAFKGAHDAAFPGGGRQGLPGIPNPVIPRRTLPNLAPSDRNQLALVGAEGLDRIPLLMKDIVIMQNRLNTMIKNGNITYEGKLAILKQIKADEKEIAGIYAQQAADQKAAKEAREAAAAAAKAERQRLAREAAERARRQRAAAAAREQARQFRLIGLSATGGEIIPGKANLRQQLEQIRARVAGGDDLPSKITNRFAGIAKALRQDITPETRSAINEFFQMVRSQFDKGDDLLKPVATRSVNTNAILKGLGLTGPQARAVANRLAGVNVKGKALAATGGVGAYGTVVQSDVYLDGAKVGTGIRRWSDRYSIWSPKQKRGPNAGR